MAAAKMENEEETAELTGLFLSDLITKHASLVFVKRMIAVAVSSITYIRGIFPEDAYRSTYLEDLCVKVLHEDCNSPSASKVLQWMLGCFDALEKQYLQIVFIGVYTNPDEPNRIIESYQLKFKYTEKGPQMDILRNDDGEMQATLEHSKRALVLFIRKLSLLMQSLDALPKRFYLTMKLFYYDDITPADYQPPGFKKGECDRLWFEGMAMHFKVAEVQTTFHSLSVEAMAEQGRLEKLQEGNKLREIKQVTQRNPPEKETVKAPRKKIYNEEALPSEDESAQFKKPIRPVAKRCAAAKNLARKKRRV